MRVRQVLFWRTFLNVKPTERVWHHGAEEAAVLQLVPVLVLHHCAPHQILPGLSGGGSPLRSHSERSHASIPAPQRRPLLYGLQELRVPHHLGGGQRQPGVPHGHLSRVLHRGLGFQRRQPQLSGILHFWRRLQLWLTPPLGLQVRRPKWALPTTRTGRPIHGHSAEPEPGTATLNTWRFCMCVFVLIWRTALRATSSWGLKSALVYLLRKLLNVLYLFLGVYSDEEQSQWIVRIWVWFKVTFSFLVNISE